MATARLDHVNIQTTRLDATVRFYADMLDLVPRDPPPPLDPALVQWMYGDGDAAIFHLSSPGSLVGAERANVAEDTGAVHHVALDCSGHDAMLARLGALGVEHRANHVVAIDLKQIFVRDPNGVLIELNYRHGNH